MELETAICLAYAVRMLPEAPAMKAKTGAYVHWHREELTIKAIEGGFSHLMMIDSDMIFPPNGINVLISRNVDIAYGTYNRKNRNYADRLDAPAGFLLINLEAVKKIKVPRFQCDFGLGEDTYFFRKAREAGLTVVCDETLEIGHIGKKVY